MKTKNIVRLTALTILAIGALVWFLLSNPADSEPADSKNHGEAKLKSRGREVVAKPDQNTTQTEGSSRLDESERARAGLKASIDAEIESFAQERDPEIRAVLIDSICQRLTNFPEFAVEWLKGLPPDDPVTQVGFTKFGLHYAARYAGDERSKRVLEDLPNDERRLSYLTGVSAVLAMQNPVDGLAFFEQNQGEHSEDKLKRAYVEIFSKAAYRQVKTIAPLIDKLPEDAKEAVGLAMISSSMIRAADNGPEIAKWISGNENASKNPEYFSMLMTGWGKHEPNAASAWLAEQPPGPAQDEGIKSLILAIGIGKRPEEAFGWAGAISDPKERLNHLTIIHARYSAIDPGAAERMVATDASLSEDEKQQLLGTGSGDEE